MPKRTKCPPLVGGLVVDGRYGGKLAGTATDTGKAVAVCRAWRQARWWQVVDRPPGPALSAAGCLRRAAVSASRRRAATLRSQGGGVGGRSAAERSEVAQRGQAFSRSPVSHTLPTGLTNCRGSRAEMADRFTVVAAIADPKGSGSAWGRSPRPQSRSAWASASSQAKH